MQFYIDGTIDSITIATDKDEALDFSLQPSSDFLKTVAEGENVETKIKKKALFIKSGKPDMAHLRDVAENESEKDIVWFSIATQDDISLKCFLLEAKNNRNVVRVFVSSNGGHFDVDFSKATALRIL